ncbi:MAG: NHL repeat-containing protein [Acidobacteriota bacterium]
MIKSRRLKKYYFLFVVFTVNHFIYSSPKNVHISLTEINECEGKIKIDLIRVWGGEEDDEAKFFKEPTDIKINKDGLFYIVDSKQNRIQVFDSTGTFIQTIGRKGPGPGEFLKPYVLSIDGKNRLIVSDIFNRRIQILDDKGKYLNSFKTKSSVYSIDVTQKGEITALEKMGKNYNDSHIVLYDFQGKMIREIGKFVFRINSHSDWDSVFFSTDDSDNFYVSYQGTPLLRKYAYSGEHIMDITYEMPFKVYHKIRPLANSKDIEIIAEKTEILVYGLSLDDYGRIYLVLKTRPLKEKEKKIYEKVVVAAGGEFFELDSKKEIESDHTDLFRLVVFNKLGKVVASKRLDVFCDNIYVHKDRLFILDSNVGMKIYEYRIGF